MVAIVDGPVIEAMAAEPLINTIVVVGAIVVALAIVGATCPVDATPKIRLPSVVLVPMTVVFDPRPRVFKFTMKGNGGESNELNSYASRTFTLKFCKKPSPREAILMPGNKNSESLILKNDLFISLKFGLN